MSKIRVPDDRIKSTKQMVHYADELTDTESVAVVRLITECQMKWAHKPNTKQNLEYLRDEVLTKMMGMNVIAEFDPAPCFYGEPPIVEIKGKVAGDPIHKHGFDHEKKAYEVVKAKEAGEDYYGEKESKNGKAKKSKSK
jgi:hypothetical protein